MKLVILAGGFGTRITEESHLKPKPMIKIGGKPILWHIMKLYSFHGIHDFIVCCGYKGYLIKEYFSNYFLHMSDVTFDMQHNEMHVHNRKAESWRVTLVDTGETTMTGGRLKRVASYLPANETFCLTYGDGLSDIDITKLLEFHHAHGCLATLSAIAPLERFGVLKLDESNGVKAFKEKPEGSTGLINGGFFVLSPKVIDYIEGDQTIWERGPLESLAQTGQLKAYKHDGFWQPMDTLRDKKLLNELWTSGKAPWKVWK